MSLPTWRKREKERRKQNGHQAKGQCILETSGNTAESSLAISCGLFELLGAALSKEPIAFARIQVVELRPGRVRLGVRKEAEAVVVPHVRPQEVGVVSVPVCQSERWHASWC